MVGTLNIYDQLVRAKIPSPLTQRTISKARENRLKLFEWMQQQNRNITVEEAAKVMGKTGPTVRIWMKDLKDEGKISNFSHNNKSYWTLSSAELYRRKEEHKRNNAKGGQ